jgi:6-phosphofructokinase 1
MGMHAGWLALASCIGRPDFVIVPEFPLNFDEFKESVDSRFTAQRHVIVVVAEGARWSDGSYIAADETEKDDFGHPRFKGSASALAARLKEDRKHRYDSRNVNSVNPSYLYRSGAPGPLDLQLGKKLGAKAVQAHFKRFDGPVLLTIQRKNQRFVVESMSLKGVQSIESLHRFVDTSLYSPQDYFVTRQGWGYLRHIINEINDIQYSLTEAPQKSVVLRMS